MSDALGQPVVIDNRGGANGTIGSLSVAWAVPDGYTLLSATVGTHVTSVHLTRNLPYDPVRDFSPIVASVEPATSTSGRVTPATTWALVISRPGA